MKGRFKRTEVWFKLVLLILFSLLYLLAIPYPEKSKQFPQLIAVFSIVMIVISLIIDLTRKGTGVGEIADVGDTELKILDETTKKARRKRFYQAWGIILISTAIGFLGGFLFSTFSLFVGFALFFGKRTRKYLLKNIFIAVVMTILIYVAFQWIMGVPLLTGILW